MSKQERHDYILSYLEEHGRISTKELVEKFNCTEDTIRKDFQILSAQGLVKRFHGGVERAESGVILYEDRSVSHLSEKDALAKAIVPYLLDKQILFIDGGTTNQRIVEALPQDFSATIVTNAIPIAAKLCEFPNVEAIMLGGTINKKIRNTEGSILLSQLGILNFDCYLMGVSTIALKEGITFPLLSESKIKQDAINRSRDIFVALTKEKFNTVSGFYAADVTRITKIFTTENDNNILKAYKESDLDIIVVDF